MWNKILKILYLDNKKMRKRFLIVFSLFLVIFALAYFFVSKGLAHIIGCGIVGGLLTWILIRPEIRSDKQDEQK